MATSIVYQKKIVAFIDVLGFSELVYSDTTDLINEYFNFVLNDFELAAQKNHFDYLLISDSIVISSNYNLEDFNLMIKVIFKLQQKLMEDAGILIRGGISFGDLYFDKSKNIIVGKGLINAYKLEAQAVYPRVIIDRRFIPSFFTGTRLMLKKDLCLTFTPPSPYHEDFVYLNYPKGFSFSNQKKKFTKVMTLLKSNYYKNEHIEKYQWLKIHIETTMSSWYQYLIKKKDKSKNERTREKLVKEFLDELQIL